MTESAAASPLISVVIPLYNKESVILETVLSVLAQSFTDFEIVVVNDGSKDSSAEIVSRILDDRIHLYNQKNSGVSAARNKGVEIARGKYIAFLDGDDSWTPRHLEEIASLIRDYGDDASVFSTNFYRQFPDGDKFINRTEEYRGVVSNYFKSIRKAVLIHTSCVCISKEAILTVGGFDTRFSIGEDIDLWNRLCRRYKLAYTSKATSIYHIDTPNNSRNRSIDYSRDSARIALRDVNPNVYDIYQATIRYVKHLIKRLINYQPRVRKPRN